MTNAERARLLPKRVTASNVSVPKKSKPGTAAAGKPRARAPRRSPAQPERELLARARIRSSALGAAVDLTFGERITVLVGRNGAGKSLLIEEIDHLSLITRPASERRREPVEVEAILDATGITFWHDYGTARTGEASVSEWCKRDGQELWKVHKGTVTFGHTKETMPLHPAAGLLLIAGIGHPLVPREAFRLQRLLKGITRIAAGPPRHNRPATVTARRRKKLELEQHLPPNWVATASGSGAERLEQLVCWLLKFHETALLDEVIQIGRRLKLWDRIERQLVTSPTNADEEIAFVLVDGMMIDRLSDGTLRVLEVLVHLVRPDCTVLLIEEPENCIHPALQTRLMAELNSYSHKKQIVLSTHSFEIVSQCEAGAIRLVQRESDVTTVRPLTSSELSNVRLFLQEEGTLGDYVFSGALDDN